MENYTPQDFERGDQIAYIPNHAFGDLAHPDVEYGFVTSTTEKVVFCRFYHHVRNLTLRTTANSEAVEPHNLVKHNFTEQYRINETIERIESEEKT